MANVGFRQFLNIRRPDRRLVELFAGIPTPCIDDNMNRIYGLSGLKPFNNIPLLGPAFTIKCTGGDNLVFNRAIDLAEPGDILVVDSGGVMDRALCGEIMISYAMSRKLGGFVINGCVRDSEFIAGCGFPVYAMGLSPNGPLKNGPGEVNVPVVAGGMAILPGDILAGDADGLVVIRPEDAEEVAGKARKQQEEERKLLGVIADGKWDRSSFAAILESKGCEIVE